VKNMSLRFFAVASVILLGALICGELEAAPDSSAPAPLRQGAPAHAEPYSFAPTTAERVAVEALQARYLELQATFDALTAEAKSMRSLPPSAPLTWNQDARRWILAPETAPTTTGSSPAAVAPVDSQARR
jgi:hypothetical protein